MPYTTLVAGTTITAAWANTNVRDQTIGAFASTGARDSAITSPVAGMVQYLTTNLVTEGLTTRNSAGQWRLPWNMPWGFIGQASHASAQSGITTSITDVTSLSVAFTAVANRVYLVTGFAMLEKGTNAGTGRIELTTAGNVLIRLLVDQKMGIGDIQTVQWASHVTGTAAGAATFKLRAAAGGLTSLTIRGDANPTIMAVYDVGPNGAPS